MRFHDNTCATVEVAEAVIISSPANAACSSQGTIITYFCREAHGRRPGLKKNALSAAALDRASEPWQAFRVLSVPYCARSDFGASARALCNRDVHHLSPRSSRAHGNSCPATWELVGPMSSRHFEMAFFPTSSTATTGPLLMKVTTRSLVVDGLPCELRRTGQPRSP
eukprot:scaffold1136_cov399-Prasinococcus_capsulatus_cf.AAC.8